MSTLALLLTVLPLLSHTGRVEPAALLQYKGERQELQTIVQEDSPSQTRVDHDGFEREDAEDDHGTLPGMQQKNASGHDQKLLDDRSSSDLSSNGPMISILGSSAQQSFRPITFVTIRDVFFEKNLGTSSLWKDRHVLPHQWLIITNKQNEGISRVYAQAQRAAIHPLIVFLHPDVFLPTDWYDELMEKLQQIEAEDPNWGVLGTAGVPLTFRSNGNGPNFIASSIVDFTTHYMSGGDNIQVQSLDEHLMVLRKGSAFFDENLPGFDLYGTDIVLSSRAAGMNAYLLNTLVFHKTVDVDGQPFTLAKWYPKINAPSYQERVLATQTYLSYKWCQSGMLPAYGCAFNVACNMM